MAYRVMLEGSNERQKFLFTNYDDAFQFASMAVESGTYQDYHFEPKDDDPLGKRVEEEPHPLRVSVQGVEE